MASLQRTPSAGVGASSSAASTPSQDDKEIPKLGIYAFIGVVFIALPLLPTKKDGGLVKLIEVLYNRFGAKGLLALPFGSLAIEKSTYDSYCAYWGQSIYADPEADALKGKHGGFPSGGAALPSFSLIETRQETDRMRFRSAALDRIWGMMRGE